MFASPPKRSARTPARVHVREGPDAPLPGAQRQRHRYEQAREVSRVGARVVVVALQPDRLGSRRQGAAGQMPRRPDVDAVLPHVPPAGDRGVAHDGIAPIRVELEQVVSEPAVPDSDVQDGAARKAVPVVRGDRGAPPPEVCRPVPVRVVFHPLRVHIAGHGQAAEAAEVVRDLGVRVGEGIGEAPPHRLGEQVDVRVAAVHQVRSAAADRPLHGEPGGGQPHRASNPVSVSGPVPGGDLDRARERADVLRAGARARQKGGVVDRFGVDGGEEPPQVKRIEEPHAVEQNGRPLAGAAPDVRHRHEVRRRRGRRRYGHRPQNVGLEHGGHGPDHGRVRHEGVPRDRDRVSHSARGLDAQGVQRDRRGREEDLERPGGNLLGAARPPRVSEGVRLDAHRPGRRVRNHERPEAVAESGRCTAGGSGGRNGDLRERDRFQGGAVAHDAGDRRLLRCQGQQCEQHFRIPRKQRQRAQRVSAPRGGRSRPCEIPPYRPSAAPLFRRDAVRPRRAERRSAN